MERSARFVNVVIETPKIGKDLGWGQYLEHVYGHVSRAGDLYPFRPSHLSVLYRPYLNLSAIVMPEIGKCHKVMPAGTPYLERVWLDPQVYIPIVHPLHQRLRDHTWVEVTHCPLDYEQSGYWMYATPGSGMYINTGRTVAFNQHEEANIFFNLTYNTSVSQGEITLAGLSGRAAALGYDTVQFLHHSDRACGLEAVEIVHTRYSGASSCGPPMRTGLGATMPCNCSEIKSPNWAFLRNIYVNTSRNKPHSRCAYCHHKVAL